MITTKTHRSLYRTVTGKFLKFECSFLAFLPSPLFLSMLPKSSYVFQMKFVLRCVEQCQNMLCFVATIVLVLFMCI